MRRGIVVVLWSILWLSQPSLSQKPAAQPSRMGDLNYFLGDWDCVGKFVRSGAGIEARQHFESILDNNFLLFRHDDKPPHNYHAWAEWGWDSAAKRFVSTVQGSSGGTRLFHSSGWEAQKLVWSGGAPGQTDDQQFIFEKLSPKEFRTSYAVLKEGSWATVDISTCTKKEEESRWK